MRRIMMTIAGTAVVLGSSLLASAQDKAPAAQAPAQAPMQAPAQAPVQKNVQAPTQSPVQKGGKSMASDAPTENYVATGRLGFRRNR